MRTSSAIGFLERTEADFEAVLCVNLEGSFLVGQAAGRSSISTAAVCALNHTVPVAE